MLLDAAVRVAGRRVVSRCMCITVSVRTPMQWLAHCEAFAQERGVAFAAQRVEVSRDAGVSVEAAARDARYRALDTHVRSSTASTTLWLAQHADDQAETVLLQLLRGAGWRVLPRWRPSTCRRAPR